MFYDYMKEASQPQYTSFGFLLYDLHKITYFKYLHL